MQNALLSFNDALSRHQILNIHISWTRCPSKIVTDMMLGKCRFLSLSPSLVDLSLESYEANTYLSWVRLGVRARNDAQYLQDNCQLCIQEFGSLE